MKNLSANKPFTQRSLFGWGALAIFIPLCLLFFFPRGGYTSDWYNSTWLAAYYGEYFRKHFEFPLVIHTQQWLGITFPIFYGFNLYPLLGGLSAVCGPHFAIRVITVLAWTLQFCLVYQVIKQVARSSVKALIVAALMSWATYPLTNLYNRSAYPEFLATSLLLSSLMSWLLIVYETQVRKKYLYGSLFVLTLCVLGGSHAITFFYGVFWVGALVLVTTFNDFKKDPRAFKHHLVIISIAGLSFILVMMPWLYALLLFKNQLIRLNDSVSGLSYNEGIDWFWVRMFPLPLDYRSLVGGVSTATSGLDAQINIPLLLLTIWTFYTLVHRASLKIVLRSRNGIVFGILSVGFLLALYISLDPRSNAWVGAFTGKLQIAYRMPSYINLTLLMGLIALWEIPVKQEAHNRDLNSQNETILLTLVTTLAFCGVLLKVLDASIILPEGDRLGYPRLRGNREELLRVPTSFYSLQNYAVEGEIRDLSSEEIKASKRVAIPVLNGQNFGEVGEAQIETTQDKTWLVTNVYIFPWNHITLNGEVVPTALVRSAEEALAIQLPSAGNYRIGYQFVPDMLWLVLRRISSYTMAVILLACSTVLGLQLRLKRE
jgi:hypothetical protein